MKKEAVIKGDFFTLFENHVARAFGLALEMTQAKRVGRHQSVVPGMPPSRMAGIGRMVEDGNPYFLRPLMKIYPTPAA